MAKGIEMNGQLRGKRGGVVYYRQNGQQVSRARNFAPSNPNTEKQRIQRMIMATVMQAYSFMDEIVDHSFEGIKYRQDSMSYFLRVNANKLRSLTGNPLRTSAYVAKGLQALVPNTYTISRGSLNTFPLLHSYSGAIYPFCFDSGLDDVAADRMTLQEFFDMTNTQPGDMLTFCFIAPTGFDLYTESRADERNILRECKFVYHRLKFKDDYTAVQLAAFLYTAEGRIVSDLIDTDMSNVDGLLFTHFAEQQEASMLYLQDESCDSLYAAAVVRSRLSDGQWRRSSADMLIDQTNYDSWGLGFEAAMLNWEPGSTNLGNGDWLLNDKLNG